MCPNLKEGVSVQELKISFMIFIVMLTTRLRRLGRSGQFLLVFCQHRPNVLSVLEWSSICLCAMYNYVSECLRVFVSAHVSVYPCLPSVLHVCVCGSVGFSAIVWSLLFPYFYSQPPLFPLLLKPIFTRDRKWKKFEMVVNKISYYVKKYIRLVKINSETSFWLFQRFISNVSI